MPVKIVTLIENSQGEHHGLKYEHGLSFYIDIDGRKLLFDLGQSGAFIENAAKLNIDLAGVEYVVVSHGHYDHSGGLRPLLKVAKRFTFVAGEGFFDAKYATDGAAYEFLGNDFDEAFLKRQAVPRRSIEARKVELCPGVFALASFPRIHDDEIVNPRFKVLRDGAFSPDSFGDELLLVLDTPKGSVVLLGCSHPGMKNMLAAVREFFPKPLRAVLGGTHLVEASEASLEKSVAYLRDNSLEIIGLSHCTGKAASSRIAASSCRQFHNGTGRMLMFD